MLLFCKTSTFACAPCGTWDNYFPAAPHVWLAPSPSTRQGYFDAAQAVLDRVAPEARVGLAVPFFSAEAIQGSATTVFVRTGCGRRPSSTQMHTTVSIVLLAPFVGVTLHPRWRGASRVALDYGGLG